MAFDNRGFAPKVPFVPKVLDLYLKSEPTTKLQLCYIIELIILFSVGVNLLAVIISP